MWLGESAAYVAFLNLGNKYGEIHIDGLDGGEVCLGDVSDGENFSMERMPILIKIPLA